MLALIVTKQNDLLTFDRLGIAHNDNLQVTAGDHAAQRNWLGQGKWIMTLGREGHSGNALLEVSNNCCNYDRRVHALAEYLLGTLDFLTFHATKLHFGEGWK